MSFSTATITHTFQNADGSAATGTVTFKLTKRMTNGSTSIMPSEITVNLDGSGHFSQSLTSNVDTGTIPTDAEWVVTPRVPPGQLLSYSIIVPSGGGSVDLGTLLPQDQQGG